MISVIGQCLRLMYERTRELLKAYATLHASEATLQVLHAP